MQANYFQSIHAKSAGVRSHSCSFSSRLCYPVSPDYFFDGLISGPQGLVSSRYVALHSLSCLCGRYLLHAHSETLLTSVVPLLAGIQFYIDDGKNKIWTETEKEKLDLIKPE